jgi:oxygen-independent coproporphyrinogen-3 oxidase
VVIARDRSRAHAYLEQVEREMAMASELVGGGERPTVQVHWGGGTPTFLPPQEITELMASLRSRFQIADGCEIGVEVDPRHCDDAQLDALVAGGVNRLSMGVQDVVAEVQRAVNRLQPAEMTGRVLEGARRRGIDSINVDLIYGLPHQTPESFAATLDQVVEWSPDRVAVFNFAYLPSVFAHQRTISPDALPDPETKLTLLELTMSRLTDAGYLLIGMDHFAKPGDPLARALEDHSLTRNFQGYSTCGETELVAFGVSSISQVGGGYAQNRKEVAEYGAALDAGSFATLRGCVLSDEDELRRDVILSIMGHFRLRKGEIEARWGVDFDRHFDDELAALEPLVADGLVETRPDGFDVTPTGRLLVRNVAMLFDAYLAADRAERYSRTV